VVGQQRRVDPAGEVAEVLERGLGVGLHLVEHVAGPAVLPSHEGPGQPHLHREGDELLLRTVVKVALEPAALFVLSANQALARRTELGDQRDVPKHKARLRRQVRDQVALGGRQRLVRRLRHGQSTEQLAAMANRHRQRGIVHRR
jgi:hypothetical protein